MLKQLASQSWNEDTAAHLLNRAGFGGTPAEIEQLRALGLEGAVENLLTTTPEPDDDVTQPWTEPVNLVAVREGFRALQNQPAQLKEKKRAFRLDGQQKMRALRIWWLARMRATRAPLVEKMTLFWHGHFATSAQKVKTAHAMWRQNETFRSLALGNFRHLLKAVSRDPAMMVYLDLQQSRKKRPNENWAREVMELFTLGLGNYTENDVRESARAFTGYRIDLRNWRFHFVAREHDETPKRFLGHTGNFNGDDILDLIVEQPACAQFIGRKLWRFFVEDEPPAGATNAIADSLRRNDFELRPVLREMFLAADFYAARVRRAQIKSPVQYLVQSCKLLQTELPSQAASLGALRAMGQNLLTPPNVKGWDGGKAWVNTATLLFRYNFASYLLNGTGEKPGVPRDLQRAPVEVAALVPDASRGDPERLVATMARRLYQAAPTAKETATFVSYLRAHESPPNNETTRHLLHLMMSTPQFQLA